MMHICKKILATLLAVSMMLCFLPVTALGAEEEKLTLEELREKYGAITVEAYNIGQGFLVEPSLYSKNGRSAGEITVDFLASEGISYQGSTSYFGGFAFNDKIQAEYPDYLTPYLGELESVGDGDGYLAEFDYSYYAGWCFTINDWWSSLGAESAYPGKEIKDYNTGEMVTLGDVIRWHYTVYGYGADCGFPGNVMAEFMGGNLFTQEDKTDLIFLLAAIHDYYGNLSTDEVYEQALAVAADPLASAADIGAQEEILTSYIEDTFLTETRENIKIYHTLNLESDIAIHYLVPTASLVGYDSFYLECILPIYEGNTSVGEKIVEIQPVLKGAYYYFTLNGLTAIHMNDVVKATLHMSEGNTTVCSETDEYSIASYAYSMLNKADADGKLRTLCADLLRYGAEAQKYKGYRTDALANSAMTEEHLNCLSSVENQSFTATNHESHHLQQPSVTWVGKALDLDSKIGIKFVFDASRFEGDPSTLTMCVSYKDYVGEERTVTLTDPQVYYASQGYYAFGFYDLLAAEMRTVLTATIYDGATALSETLTYSAESYAAKNENTALAPLCKALFAYSDSAKAFFTGR